MWGGILNYTGEKLWKPWKELFFFFLNYNVDRTGLQPMKPLEKTSLLRLPLLGGVKDCSVPKKSHQTDTKKIHGCLRKKHIWLMKNDLASMWSLFSGPWTDIDSREALWKQELSNTRTWSLFAGPDSLCWSPSIQYLPQDVHKTQGITKLNTTTCSLPDMDRSSRASNARHQKNQQALKRNKRKCRWQVFNKHIYCKGKRKTECSQCASSSTRQFTPSNVQSAC